MFVKAVESNKEQVLELVNPELVTIKVTKQDGSAEAFDATSLDEEVRQINLFLLG